MSNDINSKYLIFEVDEEYALSLSYVVEIIDTTGITRVPETPDYIAGILNLRGHVVPVIDVRMRFRKPPKPDTRQRCIVIARIAENLLGLLVDNVVDLIDIPPEKITPTPQVGGSYVHGYVQGIGVYEDKVQLIIDTDRLVNYNDLFFVEREEAGADSASAGMIPPGTAPGAGNPAEPGGEQPPEA